MKKYWLYSFALILLVASACKDDNPVVPTLPEVTLSFNATYDGQHLEKFKAYDYGTFPVKWSRFNLTAPMSPCSGARRKLFTDVAFQILHARSIVEQPDRNGCAASTAIPAGDYTGIHIGFGVKPDLNGKKPADFAPEHPFIPGIGILACLSYIFSKSKVCRYR